MLMSWHDHFLGPQKIRNGLFLLPASVLAKYYNSRIHQCSFSMILSLFLKTAYMSQCNISLHLSKSSDYALMFEFLYSLTKKKSMSVHINPMQFAQNALEGPVLHPILENFSLAPLPHPPGDNTPRPRHSQKHEYTTDGHYNPYHLSSVIACHAVRLCWGERNFFIVCAMINKVHFV